jgi:cytochrome c peroxidase
MPGSEKDTPILKELGKKLYFDKRLSINDSQACNSCHILDNNKAGVDNLVTSPGALKKTGTRNSPSVFNAGFQIAQFWDGRALDLKEQAKGPILNPIEMGMPSDKAVMTKIKGIKEYQDFFPKAYPGQKDPFTYDNLANAIAAFERTFITKSRFDDFLAGDVNALNEKEKEGARLFLRLRCTQCHESYMIGGMKFQKLGTEHPYENITDLGKFEQTKQEGDKYVFKVPTLRNVSLTYPYFHDGKALSLEKAVKKIAYLQLDKKLTDEEVTSIVHFLKTLNGKNLK